MDSWNNAFVYQCPGAHNTNAFDIYSLGPDGVSKTGGGDPDDINNWSRSMDRPSKSTDRPSNSPLFPDIQWGTILFYVGGPVALLVLVAAICGSFLRFFRKEHES